MKIKQGYLLRKVAGSNIVVPVGEGSLDFSGVITLNEVGAFLWQQLAAETTKEELVKKLTAEYDVDDKTADTDTEAFLDSLRKAGLLDE